MAWEKGISWTKGAWTTTTNPDGSIIPIRVHGGLFIWLPINLTKSLRLEFYAGFRPTPTWGIGYGNEGDTRLFTMLGQWLKQVGWGNLGLALRLKKRVKESND